MILQKAVIKRNKVLIIFRNIIKTGITVLGLIYLNPAIAVLNLTLTQGISGAQPIAVIPFEGNNNVVTDIIRQDLNNSGKFKTLEADQFPAAPTDAAQVNFDQWKILKLNDLVIGTIKSRGFDHYQIHFQLLDIYKGNPPLLDQTMVVSKEQLRAAAHHISDLIYQSLTGIKGIFSTRLAYILVNREESGIVHYALEVSDYDGYNSKPILVSTQPIMSPAWSHDGKKIAYVSFENEHMQIYISSVNTGARKLLTNYPGINGAPAYSPNDTQIALVLSKSGSPKIYVMNANTQSIDQLTTGNAIDTEPNFSPDGQSLLFTSDRGGSPQLYRLSLDNRQISRLTFNGSYNARGSFASNGSSIIMIHSGSDANGYGIGLQDLQSGAYLVLDNAGDDQSPSFAPNSQMVVFASKTGAHRQLAIVSIDGRIKLRLPSSEAGEVQEPVWSPFIS